MKLPPAIVDLRVPRSDGRRLHLWLPLFLLWPLLLLLAPLLLAIALVYDFVQLLAGATYHHATMFLGRSYIVLCDTRELSVHVTGPSADFEMTLL
jgi:hypothetical protein